MLNNQFFLIYFQICINILKIIRLQYTKNKKASLLFENKIYSQYKKHKANKMIPFESFVLEKNE